MTFNPYSIVQQSPPVQIFLSHASENHEWVERIADHARSVGVNPYVATRDPRPGTYLADKIRAAIKSSAAMLVLLTEAAYASRYVTEEIGAARQEGTLMVVLADPVLRGKDLSMLQGLEVLWFDYDNPASSVAPLISTLSQIMRAADAAQRADQATHRANEPVLQVDWRFEGSLQLTPNQALIGLAVVALVVVIIMSNDGGSDAAR